MKRKNSKIVEWRQKTASYLFKRNLKSVGKILKANYESKMNQIKENATCEINKNIREN